jgi:SH3 domain protein
LPARRALAAMALTALVLTLAIPAVSAAESAWVRGEVRLNVRTGAGTQFRILSGLKTGDHVEIQARSESWIKVRLDDGAVGWIPVGYLEAERPPALKLELLENETAELRKTSAANSRQVTELSQLNEALTSDDEQQRLEIDQLRRENMRLKAGARWPEWITGASIVCVGMIIGAILQRTSGRRSSSRIRL